MLVEIETADMAWTPTVGEVAGGVLALGYTCPRCQGAYEIRIQPPAAGEPTTSTEMWCHRCQHGAPVTVRSF